MFVTPYNYDTVLPDVIQEEVSDEILVEPSDAYTIRELIYRLAMGMPVASSPSAGEYPDTDQDFDDIQPTEAPDFDLADYARIKEEISSKYTTKVVEKKISETASKEPETTSNDTPST